MLNILFVGDIVGRPGRTVLKELLPAVREEHAIDFVIANGENASGGLGLTPMEFEELLAAGIDSVTSGNHIWKKKEIFECLDDPRLLRPANYPDTAPGRGYSEFTVNGHEIAVVNLQGRVFMEAIDCPFICADRILKDIKAPVVVIDFHAEATSEKIALAWYLDGRVTAILGTHTHVQTADEKIFPDGTGFISDAGMTGSAAGVIGVRKDAIVDKFLSGMPFSYKPSKGDEYLNAVIVSAEPSTGRCCSVKRINMRGGL
jgi:metallophosphoesterase (TIGR00282 family)